jgi:hypothetical protein
MSEPTIGNVILALFGPDWRQRAPALLGYSRRQVERWLAGEARMSRRVLVLLRDQHALTAPRRIEQWRRREIERIEIEAAQWLDDAAQAETALRLMIIRVGRLPPPRVGRPRGQAGKLPVPSPMAGANSGGFG